MDFERCSRYGLDEWAIIDTDTLLKEVSNEQIDMMIFFKATVRLGDYQYRRHIPANIIDWAKQPLSV